jgi:tRNA threonylcarbamoyladenosine biosynthesis protein TsaE
VDSLGTVTRRVESRSTDETVALGERLGSLLSSGDFVGLNGQLGAGKTLFCRGVASGAGVTLSDFSSPTYSIVQTYSGRLPLHHADLYRLRGEGDLFAAGYFDLLESEGAMLVEWVSQIPSARPDDSILIGFEALHGETRSLMISARGARSKRLFDLWLGPAATR